MLEIAKTVLEEITKFGYKAYIVGGYPRDMYLKRPSTDIDICTDATPMEIMNIFPEVVTSNSEYGTVTISVKKIRFEITTFRIDGKYKDYRKPKTIKYITDLEEDLKRRDFTINTLCIDKDNNQIDLMNAKSDLDNKIIRMVGNPKIRLKEDALRILRAIRFATQLDFQLEPVLKVYIKKYGPLLRKLSYTKKRDELDLIFASPNKEYGIKLLCELKLDNYLDIPKLKNIKITPSMIVTWSQLDVLNKYSFSSNEKETITQINILKNKDLLDKTVLYEYGLYPCTLASELTNTTKKELNEVYASMPIHSKKDIDITPEEICTLLDKKPGPFLKELIKDLETQILNDNLKNDKVSIQTYLKKTYL